MWIDWIGGWASHGLAWYIGVIMGLISGVFLSWHGDHTQHDELDQQGSTTPEGGHRAR